MDIKVTSKIKLYQQQRSRKIRGANHSIQKPDHIAHIVRSFLQGDIKESMIVLALDTRHNVIAVYEVFSGTLNSVQVSPREIMQFALLNNAHAIAVAHNHPSSSLEPSAPDLDFSFRLSMAGELLKINVLDHLIVTDDAFVSIRQVEEGLFMPRNDNELYDFVVSESDREYN